VRSGSRESVFIPLAAIGHEADTGEAEDHHGSGRRFRDRGGGYHVFEVRHDLERRRSVLGVRPFVSVVRSIAIYNEVNVGNFNAVEGERTRMETDLASMLVLLMTRLTDSADDDGIVDDFCESFHLSKKAVVAAVKAYRHASATVH
jgi:hypothetical protein